MKRMIALAGVSAAFALSASGASYFVNDAYTNGDVYCTAVGNDANPGTNAAAPKLTVSSVLSTYTLAPGDIVYIDTGHYSNETVTITTSGSSGNLITFQGSTNYLAGGSRFVRNSPAADGFNLAGAEYIRLADLRIRNALRGVHVLTRNCVFERVYSVGSFNGFRITNNDNTFRHCVAAYNSEGVNNSGNNIVWENGIFWQNTLHLILSPGTFPVRNSVFVGGTLFGQAVSTAASDFNVLWNVAMDFNPTFGTRQYAYLSEMQNALNGWFNSIVAEPRFANPDELDFHELSPMGRYNPAVTNFVTTDSVFSVTIDFGDPSFGAWTNEPAPNGGRINAGIYGGTSEASKSRTNAWLLAIRFNDGGTLTQSGRLYWTFGNLTNTSTVRLEYSPNFGSNWLVIATNVPITNAFFAWNAAAVTSTPAAYWRVMSELNTNVFDANDNYFVIKGTTNRINYYVNDGSTNGDVYCTATGHVANTGLSPSSPKATLQQILDAYDLGPNDVVYVDTGLYLTNTTTIGFEDQGASGAPVTIQGSTNYATGGTIFDRQSALSDVIFLSGAQHIRLANLRVQNGNRGVFFTGSNIEFFQVIAASNVTAFMGSGSLTGILFDRCAMSRNVQGVFGFAGGWRWLNGVSWSNTTAFTTSGGSTPWIVTNSVIVGGTAFNGSIAPSDYTVFWNATFAAGLTNLHIFQESQNAWWRSGVVNPAFANPEALDFRERSQAGRYDPATKSFISDTVTSVTIDFADPTIAVSNEPAPNGGRMNAGMFGNTGEASKSRTNAWIQTLSYNDGGTLDVGVDSVYWNAGAYASGATVRIELSRDGGLSWSVIATNVQASAGSYLWANTNFLSSELGRWRVVYEANTNVFSASGPASFIFKNGPFSYYINDGSTIGDVYCTAPGNDANPGTGPGNPKATLKGLLTARDILPGDVIYIDTGVYNLIEDQIITALDDGDTNGFVTILGSTNCAAGTVFNRFNTGVGLYVSGASFLDIRDITVTNAATGVRVEFSPNIRLTRITARGNSGNGFEVVGSPSTRVERAVGMRNGNNGLLVSSGGSALIEHSVFWRNSGSGLRVDGGRAMITNSIVVATGGSYAYFAATTTNIIGNYNNVFTQTNSLFGFVSSLGRNLETHAAWVGSTTQEVMSLSTDPLFFNPDQGDFHLKTSTREGRFIPCTGFNPAWDFEDSPCIDAGSPTSAFSNEVPYNGSRVNIGLYGNTPEASKRTNTWLHAASLREGGWVKGVATLHWVAGGAATGHTVRVEVSTDGGLTWSILTNGAPAATEAVAWNTATTNNSPACLWRVTSLTNTNIYDATTNFFAIRNAALSFYINNGSTTGDMFTSAAGSPTNWVATSNKPLNSLATAFAVYDIEPGDVFYVDTGAYTNAATAVLGIRGAGESNNPVRIVGSTNYAVGGSVIHRTGSAPGVNGLALSGTRWIAVSNITFRGGHTGVQISDSLNVTMDEVRSLDAASNGFFVLTSSNVVFQRAVAQGNRGFGALNQSAGAVRWLHSVFLANSNGAISQIAGEMGVSNSVLTASGSGRYVYTLNSNAQLRSDFNNIRATNDAFVALDGGVISKKLSRWRETRANDIRSLSHEPRFANPAAQDFHLLSSAGRFDPLTSSFVATDTVFSLMIDAGDPQTSFANEPTNNGRRVNIGLYGNHPQESRSPTNGWFTCLSLNDGGSIRGTNNIHWVAGGVATTHVARIDYSANGGATWSNIASNIAAAAGNVMWTTTLFQSSALGKWRIVSQSNTNFYDETDQLFAVDNGPLTYYVNDSSTNGDVYTSNPGSPMFDGTSPDAPVPSIGTILSRYDLNPGDLILVDSGTYGTFSPVTFGMAGHVTNRIRVQGSTNRTVGTVLDVQNNDFGIVVDGASALTIQDIKIINARKGVTVANATNVNFAWVSVDRVGIGFEVSRSAGVIFSNCVASRGSTNGVLNLSSTGMVWLSGVLWSNTVGVRVGVSPLQFSPAPDFTISNSVISAYGPNALAYQLDSGTLVANYNNIFLVNGARAATVGAQLFSTIYDTVARWARATGRDTHSLTHDPLFADPANGDFHLRSTAGRFNPLTGAFTNDTVTSPLIDAGHPAAAFANEPTNNGARVNIGLYGNTPEASRTPTNAVFTAVSLNDGGVAGGTNVLLYWVPRGDATQHTVRLEYSVNSGTNWTTIVSGLAATNANYLWNSTTFTSSLTAKWRVLSLTDMGIFDPTDAAFMLRNSNLIYYVNDASTNGDMYTSAPGLAGNTGTASNAPKHSVQAILDAYDLEPGDTIVVDTGTYTAEHARALITQLDAGASGETNPLTIRGSTNVAAGGTTLNAQGGDYGVKVEAAAAVNLRDLTISGVTTSGVVISQGLNNQVTGVKTRGGQIGFQVLGSLDTRFDHCVAIGATVAGVNNASGSNTVWRSGVLWSNQTAVLSSFVQGSFTPHMIVSNSALSIFGSGRQAYTINAGNIFGNYNNFYLVGGARAAGGVFDTVAAWVAGTGQDTHSLTHDPLFHNPGAEDFHLKSTAVSGRFDAVLGVWTNDSVTSPMIDAGDPLAAFGNEPPPNGNRVNIGLYGNTPQASRSPTNGSLLVLSFNDGGKAIGSNVVLRWLATGVATTHTVEIVFSWDDGETWVVLTSGVAAASGQYTWNSTLFTTTVEAIWGLYSLASTNIADYSDKLFGVRNNPMVFFVNDGGTNGDVYTSAPGHATNKGLKATAPKANLQQIITTWDLEPGDIVYVDTGVYSNNFDTVLDVLDAGIDTNEMKVVIQGSTNEMAGGTVFDRLGGANGILLNGANGIDIRNLTIRNAQTGVNLSSSAGSILRWVNIIGGGTGFQVSQSSNARFEHCTVRGASQGISSGSAGVTWQHGVLWSNTLAVNFSGGSMSFNHSVIGAIGSGAQAFNLSFAGISSDYNNYFLTNGATFATLAQGDMPRVFHTVSRWVRDTGLDTHSLTHDPGFVNPDAGDFHLKSSAVSGRFDSVLGIWTNDATSSVLIDAGNPAAAFDNEPEPNGGRINIGLYGNTPQASKTPTNGVLTTISLNDGGRAEGVILLRWLARGVATGHTARLDYSPNAGATWTNIVTNVSAAAGLYVWDSVSYTSSIRGFWRIVSENNTNVFDQTDALFALRNSRLSFFVNNPATNGDMYCTAPGNATNHGTLASAPKASVQDVLATWDLEPGDTIFVDTGFYSITNDTIVITRFDAWEDTNLVTLAAGLATNRLTIQGSTNEAAGGTIMSKTGGGQLIHLSTAPGIALRNLTLRPGTFASGVRSDSSAYCLAQWVRVENGGRGFDLVSSDAFEMLNCLAFGSSGPDGRGLSAVNCADTVWRNGILWSNTFGTFQQQIPPKESKMTVENSIFGVFGSNSYAHLHVSGTKVSDYNNIYLAKGGFAGGTIIGGSIGGATQRYESVFFWQRGTGLDLHTLSEDPKFANLAAGDFHLKTTRPGGRFNPLLGVWTNDTEFSRLIDAGNPATDFSQEPGPNGSRVNIGLYGGSPQASKTPTNSWFTILSLNDGGTVQDFFTLRWVSGGAATGNTVILDFSPVAGTVWTNITVGIPSSAGEYVWDSCPYGRSLAGLWRVISVEEGSVAVTSRVFFVLRPGVCGENPGQIPFFVNDASTNNDVYTSGPGSPFNEGIDPAFPAHSIQKILDNHKLEPFDIIYVDTGSYLLPAEILVQDLDSGFGTNRVTIQGSTNFAAGGTVLNAQGMASAIRLSGARGFDLRHLTVRNASAGIQIDESRDCTIHNVRAQNNSFAGFSLFESTINILFSNCVARNNGGTNAGVGVFSAKSALTWLSGTIWDNNGGAVGFQESGPCTFRNSVLQASGVGRRIYNFDILTPTSVLQSDYNNLIRENGAQLAEIQVTVGGNDLYGYLYNWQKDLGKDTNSLSHDPEFVDAPGGDFTLKSQQGRFLPNGTLTNDPVTSPLLDTGDPAMAFTNEPSPNGGRVNIGNFANTRSASLSLTNPWLLAVSFNDGGVIGGTVALRWVSGNLPTNELLRLDYTRNNGVEWSTIASNVPNGSSPYMWDISQEAFTALARWRVVRQNNTNLLDQCDSVFTIKNNILTIYVNDSSTNGDVFCTAPGHPSNSGLSNNVPLSDPAEALIKYPSMGPGDFLFIDTGVYAISNDMVIGELNRGEAGAPVRLQGSTNRLAGGTLIDRGTNGIGLTISNARYIEVDHLRFSGGVNGISAANSVECSFSWIETMNAAQDGMNIGKVLPARLSHCASRNNGGFGINVNGTASAIMRNGVLWSNAQGGAVVSVASLNIEDSIVHSARTNSYLYRINNGSVAGNYNVLWAEPGAGLMRDDLRQITFRNLAAWQRDQNAEHLSALVNPEMINPEAGDFHLKSPAGRYFNGTFVTTDVVASWAIDAGRPTAAFTNEPLPNGARINAGLHGNTVEASKSVTNPASRALFAASLRDGGTVRDTFTLYWLSRAMLPSDTVRIEVSINSGQTWSVIATGISATAQGYAWDTTSVTSTPLALWRVCYEATNSFCDQPPPVFTIRNKPFNFYVNDASTNGDVYTQGVGSPANLGLEPHKPKASLQGILAAYDLEGGDTVFVDTGVYPCTPTNELFIDALVSGVATAKTMFVGSTNRLVGGTVLQGEGSNSIVRARFVNHVALAHFIVQGGGVGVALEQNNNFNVFSNLLVRDCSIAGVNMSLSSENRFDQTVITRINGPAVQGGIALNNVLDRCVLWNNQSHAVSLSQSTMNISNSVLSASGQDAACILLGSNATVKSDYNAFFVTNDAFYGISQNLPLEGLPQWVAFTTQDVHSIAADPLFFNPAIDDYHLRSATGRYSPTNGAYVTTDTNFSYLIDTGDPTSSFTNEPAPNGGRRNIGLYGDTTQASKSRTNAWLLAISGNAGGRFEGTFSLVWAYGGGITPTNLARLDYSMDAGVTWSNISTTQVGALSYVWESDQKEVSGSVTNEKWITSPIGKWRIMLLNDTNIYDETDRTFALRNKPILYYVNDPISSLGDIYCNSLGNDNNLGFLSNSPMATLKALVDKFDLEGGDPILIDSGTYLITTNNFAVVGLADAGKPGLPLLITGNTNEMRTVLDRASQGLPANIITLNGQFVTVQNMVLLGGNISAPAGNATLRNLVLTNGSVQLSGSTQVVDEVRIAGGSIQMAANQGTISRVTISNGVVNLTGTNILMRNSLIYGGPGPAVQASGVGIILRNNTLATGGSQFRQTTGSSTLENNIIVASGPNNFCLQRDGGVLISDYNNLVARNGAWIGNQNGLWEKLLYWQRESNNDRHSLAHEPLFADEAAGDYHLRSLTGRFTTTGFVSDVTHSPSIDAANPATALINETDPNGGRVNQGAYGNTVEASRSRTNAWLLALTMNDGGVLKGTNTIRWLSGNIACTNSLVLQYSPNNGATWSNIATVSGCTNEYIWNTTLFPSSLGALWRVVLLSNTSVFDQTDSSFAVRNVPLGFYVNDASTNNDVYAVQPGHPTNDGLTAATPKDSIAGILSAYDVEGGDVIYVDTGVYSLGADTLLIWSRSGDADYGHVVIQGSTNPVGGGAVLVRNNTAGGIGLDIKGSYVTVRDLNVRSALRGIFIDSNRFVNVERVLSFSNEFGIVAANSISPVIRNARLWRNRQGGIDLLSSATSTVENCVFFGNEPFSLRVQNSPNSIVQNNIFGLSSLADTNASTALAGQTNNIFIDYNVYYYAETNSFIYGSFNNLLSWQLLAGHDYRSAVTNPLMANPAAGDFHLRSTAGRYQDGVGFTNDAVDSWAIDRGNPLSPFTNEPPFNGNRVNIGAYGNTPFASKSKTNVVLQARQLNDPVFIVATNSIWPLIWSAINLPSNTLVHVQYSGDGGKSWVNLHTNINVYQEYVFWQAAPFYNTFKGLWRVVGASNTNVVDMNDAMFHIFFGQFAISSQTRPEGGLNRIVWRGAWDENYQVQYAESKKSGQPQFAWTNAPTGPGTNQKANFISTFGGDLTYEDIGSATSSQRVYRVLWQYHEPQ